MASGLTSDQIADVLANPEAIRRDPFDLLRQISRQIAVADAAVAQKLVLRALDKRELFHDHAPILNSLVRQVGLYPYLDTATLSGVDLLAYEYHRPLGLDRDLVFHQVQASVYRNLLEGRNVILSAPTSFGKSLIIDALIASGLYTNIVIVVPTISLIDETRRRLSQFSHLYKVSTHTSQRLAGRNILIYTQERVVDHHELPAIDLFVIDEFYKLSPNLDEDRSALLNQAFYKLFKTGAQFYLLGPDIRNLPPELPERLDCLFIRTDYATVVSETHRVRSEDTRRDLINLCQSLEEPTLIYCRSPKRVRDVAEWMLEDDVDGRPNGIESAVSWIAREYHPEWRVAKALSRGIALHHGRMPRALSQYMVRAFNEHRAKYLICTSTLIEGVNTKAKNVIVLDNKIARQRYDYFTFNNIRGRSGRMFEHFIGRVFLFHDPPQEELPLVDVPVFTQPDQAPISLLVQLDSPDLLQRSRERLAPFIHQDTLDLSVIRANSGIDPALQIALAQRLRAESDALWPLLSWTGYPTYQQLESACVLIWQHLRATQQPKAGVFSARQLAFKINQLRRTPSVASLIRQELSQTRDPDEAVERVLDFVRQWATFEFPRLLMALHRIQEAVFQSLDRQPGDFSAFAAMVEGLFMRPPLAALDEYGIPLQTAQKLQPALRPDGDLDDVLLRLKNLDPQTSAAILDEFEVELVNDARKHL